MVAAVVAADDQQDEACKFGLPFFSSSRHVNKTCYLYGV